nr:hypothetical protein [uncultured Porphyromonas sp.]
MLQAILHKKNLRTPTGKRSEDALTSSTIGLLQYLPDETFWQILYEASKHTLPEFSDAGAIENISFWEEMSAKGTTNQRSVEPDVWLELERIHLIIEAKRHEEGGQYEGQWLKEIQALLNTLADDDKRPIWLLALGGNYQTSKQSLTLGDKTYPIIKIRWQTLLEEVKKYTYEFSPYSSVEKRICNDIIKAFELFGYFSLKWLDSFADISPTRLASSSIDTLFHLPNYK